METKDYKKFNHFDWNREINEKWVNKIADSMKEFGWIGAPIYINSLFYIWDGQHRTKAAEKAGIPVKYEIDDNWTPATVASINSTTQIWSPEIYVHFYKKQGNPNYDRLDFIHEKYKIGYDKILRVLNVDKKMDNLKNGTFVLTMDDFQKANNKITQIMRIFNSFSNGSANVKYTACLFIVENYNSNIIDNLCDRISKSTPENINYENTQILLNSLERIYNKRKKYQDNVFFGDDFKHSTAMKAVNKRREKYHGKYQSKQLFD